jgi:hypothetical protein
MKNKGVIIEVPACRNQFLSNLFLVSKKDGCQRPVINLRYLSAHVKYQHCKMEGLFVIKNLLQRGDFLLKIDLKEAYSVMSISPKYRKFLRFQWYNKIYQHTALPFGLVEAPRIFTKTLKPVLGLLRRLVVILIIYLDDILIMAESREKLRSHRDSTLYLLQKLGYVINWKKTILNPTQEIEYLGFQINSEDMMFYRPKTKIDKKKSNCQNILSKGRVSVREIAKLTGKFISSIQVFFSSNLHCRFLQMSQIKGLLVGNSYEQNIILSKEAREELN